MAAASGMGMASQGSNLTFTAPRLEEVYLVYTAEKNRGLTLRLHYLLAAAWGTGAAKTLAQAAFALRLGERSILPQYAFLLLAQLTNFGYQLASMPRLRSMARQDQLQQERTKAWLHVLLDVAVMVCVILSDPTLPHSPAPLSAMVMTCFLAVLDMIRLETLLRLHAIKWLCFLFLEADRYLRVPGHTLQRVGDDALRAALLGTLLPFLFAALGEASQREAFLRDCKRPLVNLGPFWGAVCSLLRRLPLRAPPPAQATDAHVD